MPDGFDWNEVDWRPTRVQRAVAQLCHVEGHKVAEGGNSTRFGKLFGPVFKDYRGRVAVDVEGPLPDDPLERSLSASFGRACITGSWNFVNPCDTEAKESAWFRIAQRAGVLKTIAPEDWLTGSSYRRRWITVDQRATFRVQTVADLLLPAGEARWHPDSHRWRPPKPEAVIAEGWSAIEQDLQSFEVAPLWPWPDRIWPVPALGRAVMPPPKPLGFGRGRACDRTVFEKKV